MIHESSIIHPNVELGENVIIEEFCIIGKPVSGDKNPPKTIIGDHTIIRSHTVIYAGNHIGSHFATGHHVTIRQENKIGDHVSVGTQSVIEFSSEIAQHVRIHSQAFIPEYSCIKEHAWIGPNAALTNAKYPQSPNCKDKLKGPTLHAHVKVGANATILPGVEIGKNTLIGAGAVVTKNVPANQIIAGNPAKEIRDSFY